MSKMSSRISVKTLANRIKIEIETVIEKRGKTKKNNYKIYFCDRKYKLLKQIVFYTIFEKLLFNELNYES